MGDVGIKLVAHENWQWHPGMHGHRTTKPGGHTYWMRGHFGLWFRIAGLEQEHVEMPPNSILNRELLPDLTDPATLGCLWAMLVEALPGAWDAALRLGRHGNIGPAVCIYGPIDTDSGWVGQCMETRPLPEALLWVWERGDG